MAANLDLLSDQLRDAARALVDAASAAGLQPRVTSTLRSRAEQTRLYRRYLAGGSGYPVAPPGASAHELGLAFDMVVSPMDALADVGYTWQTWGGGWNPADAIHFEVLGASEQAKAARPSLSEMAGTGWWENFVAGMPIAFWPSIVLDWLGIPSSAKMDITPAQEATLRKIALSSK
jgi:hypothetical protein